MSDLRKNIDIFRQKSYFPKRINLPLYNGTTLLSYPFKSENPNTSEKPRTHKSDDDSGKK